ncbi:MAG: ATP-binding cassette domain-containing protein [Saprospiraceae bacterium]|nr:ATP-binding cassette domain-containing protein [Saprospiraceae bacterium]
MDVLNLETCSKAFGSKEVLRDVCCSLHSGEVLAIFGRNGCGKSTLMNILFGTLAPDKIDMRINDKVLNLHDIRKRRLIGYLPQHSFLPGDLRVRDVVPFFLYDGGDQNKVFYAAGIPEISAKKINTLSIGQRRYLEFLLVGNIDHAFLLLDEPFSMIEPLYKDHIKAHIKVFVEQKGILVTDHYYEDVWQISTKNMVMEGGILSEVESKDELRKHGYLARKDP